MNLSLFSFAKLFQSAIYQMTIKMSHIVRGKKMLEKGREGDKHSDSHSKEYGRLHHHRIKCQMKQGKMKRERERKIKVSANYLPLKNLWLPQYIRISI